MRCLFAEETHSRSCKKNFLAATALDFNSALLALGIKKQTAH
jgi:hypothetical protein